MTTLLNLRRRMLVAVLGAALLSTCILVLVFGLGEKTAGAASLTPSLNDGLIAYYPFSGDTKDASGNGHVGTPVGSPTFSSNVPTNGGPSSLTFDGTSNYVSVDDTSDLNFSPTSPLSVSTWVYRTSDAGIQHMLGKRPGCVSDVNYQLAYINGRFGFGGYTAATGTGTGAEGGNIPLNTWTHVTGTFDGTTFRIYVDGAKVGENTGTLGPTTTDPLMIGTSGNCQDYGQGWGGSLDDVKIYNRALSDTEVGTLADPNSGQNNSVSWSGILQPINTDGSSVFKLGSTIPVKFKLTGDSASITDLNAKLYVAKISNGVVGTEMEPSSTAAADSGNTFRYDPTSQQYVYNLSTKDSTKNWQEGTYQLRVDLGDGELHTVNISLKK